ncbi:hypothetical protein QJS04_geneDACA000854 [Acorus gramineus]|uniref:Uncharacterized protein n=1 Tax=Acorus gramineus TaxID=55184 RepID=A0AAV9BJQ6_ACOGR|nr:hypothetical protein QJS04_geneDACA000854 [Acorus gramineus]
MGIRVLDSGLKDRDVAIRLMNSAILEKDRSLADNVSPSEAGSVLQSMAYQGQDLATIIIEDNGIPQTSDAQGKFKKVDEIKQYLDCSNGKSLCYFQPMETPTNDDDSFIPSRLIREEWWHKKILHMENSYSQEASREEDIFDNGLFGYCSIIVTRWKNNTLKDFDERIETDGAENQNCK